MRKYGKYERRPSAKSMLLRTYFTSLLCLVLCVAMFFGTSYAWFSDTAQSTENEMFVGTLDIELKHTTFIGGVQQKTNENMDVVSENYPIFKKVENGGILWEPGYTAVEKFELTENGDLAFSYQMSIARTFAETGEDAQKAIAEHITVWNYIGTDAETYALPENFNALTTSGWTKVGTLYDVITNHLPVFEGEMDKEAVTATKTEGGETVQDPAKAYHLIALHMDEDYDGAITKDADGKITASVQGNKLDKITIKLVATQKHSEQDAFDNTYDAAANNFAVVSTADELEAALIAGGKVVLAGDIDLEDKQITIPAGVTATLNLNGHTITAPGGEVCAVKNEGSLIIEGDGTITGSYSALYSTGNLTVNGGTFTATAGFGLLVDNIYGTDPSVAVINGGTFTGVGIYNPTAVTINGGIFNEGDDPDGAMNNVTLYVSPTFVGAPNTATVTLNGGIFNGDIYVYDDGITETVFTNNGATINGEVRDNA